MRERSHSIRWTPTAQRDLRRLPEKIATAVVECRLSHHTTRMQGRGLIDKEPDPQDARGCILHLTDDGFGVLEEAARHHVASVRARFLDHLSSDELAVLRQLSTRIADLPR